MDITIGVLVIIMKIKGQDANWSIPLMMGMLVLITIFLLVTFFKNLHPQKDVESKIKYFYPLRS